MMNFDTGFLLADSSGDFSSTQGTNNRYYYRSPSTNAYNELIRDSPNTRRAVASPYNSYDWLYLNGVEGHPGSTNYGDAVRARRAPLNAKINIIANISD